MDDKPLIPAAVKGGAAIAAATGAQLVDGAHQASSVMSEFFTLTPANLASWLAALFVASQLFHFWWKILWRPFFERKGWLSPKKPRRVSRDDLLKWLNEETDNAPL